MVRRVAIAAFMLAVVLSTACGRQVTPNPGSGGTTPTLGAGTMLVTFDTVGTLDLTTYSYVILFNTSGQGGEPYANALASGTFANYSFALVVGGTFGTAAPTLIQYYVNPGVSNNLQFRTLQYDPSQLTFTNNSNGRNTEFQILFNRNLLNVASPVATPTPAATATPSPG
ncbi:MAG: hypothetical protein ACREM6_06835, partial [Vulcanimicrobiaceae bacterium]